MTCWCFLTFSLSALCSLDSVSGPAVSIQTELALEQLRQKHSKELQQLHIQLETQVLITNMTITYTKYQCSHTQTVLNITYLRLLQ